MKLIKEYLCDSSVPKDTEIKECIEIANREDCIVKLRWFFEYSGWYELNITKGMTFEECEDKLPKYYPV